MGIGRWDSDMNAASDSIGLKRDSYKGIDVIATWVRGWAYPNTHNKGVGI